MFGLFLLLAAVADATARAASAQALSIGELEGTTARVRFVTDQLVQREGRRRSVTQEENLNVTVKSGGEIAWQYAARWRENGGPTQVGQTRTWIASLDEPWDTPAGRAMWQFSDGKLTFIRSHQTAAARTVIAFSYTSHDLTCTADKSILHERGKSQIVTNSVVDDGTPVTILNWKLISSSCSLERSGSGRK